MIDAHEFIQMGGYKVNNKEKCLKQIEKWDGITAKQKKEVQKQHELNEMSTKSEGIVNQNVNHLHVKVDKVDKNRGFGRENE